jgi:hypothetical protein
MIAALQMTDLNMFADGSRVREHIHKLDPGVEPTVAEFVTAATAARDKWLEAMRTQSAGDYTIDAEAIEAALSELAKRIETDIARLTKEDSATAIRSLELEHQTLRHREVLSQLIASIETHVADAKWCVTCSPTCPRS